MKRNLKTMISFYKKVYVIIRDNPGISMRGIGRIANVSPQVAGNACNFLWGRRLIKPYTNDKKITKKTSVFHWVVSEKSDEPTYENEKI